MRFKLKTAWRYFLLGLVLSLILGGAALYFENGTYMQPPMVLYLMTAIASTFAAMFTGFGRESWYKEATGRWVYAYQPCVGGFPSGFAFPLWIAFAGMVVKVSGATRYFV